MDEMLSHFTCFLTDHDYPYVVLGANGWLRCDRLHCSGFPTLLQNVLHCFGFTGSPTYHGRLYCEFGCGCCEVHLDISTHPLNLSLTAWFTTATGDDLDNTLERAVQRALTEFCECHLSGLVGTTVGLLPIRTWETGSGVSVRSPLVTPHFRPTTSLVESGRKTGWGPVDWSAGMLRM
jgi:hypothetical protein